MRILAFICRSIMLPLLIIIAPHAEIVEVQIPELQGWYSHPDSVPDINQRTATINLGRIPSYIRGAWLILSVDITGGSYRCPASPPDYTWPYSFYASLDDSVTGGYWSAVFFLPGSSGNYQIISQFSPQQGATWEFLTSEIIQLQLYGDAFGIPADCVGITSPFAFVANAIFRIDADFDVPVSTESWGRIKALYGDISD